MSDNDPLEDTRKLEKSFSELESSIQGFTNIQSVIGEETINAFEVLFMKLDGLQSSVDRLLLGQENSEQDNNFNSSAELPVSTQMPVASLLDENSDNGYLLECQVDRKGFLEIQNFLAQVKKIGKGVLSFDESELTLSYYTNEITKFSASGVNNNDIRNCVEVLQKIQIEAWEKMAPSDLIQILTEIFQSKTKYLGGIISVLQKVPKEQLIEKLKSNMPPLVNEEEGQLYGEGLFHYFLYSWPDKGHKFLRFSFAENVNAVNKKNKSVAGTTIPSVLNRYTKFEQAIKETDKKSGVGE